MTEEQTGSVDRTITTATPATLRLAPWLRVILGLLAAIILAVPALGFVFAATDPEFRAGANPIVLLVLLALLGWVAWSPLMAAITGRSRTWAGVTPMGFAVIVLVGAAGTILFRMLLRALSR